MSTEHTPEPDHEQLRVNRGDGRILFWIIASLSLVAAGIVVWPFIGAILWAVVLSVLMWPYYRRLRKRFNDLWSSLFTVLVTAFLIVLPFVLFGTIVGGQAYKFANEFVAQQGGADRVNAEVIAAEVDTHLKPVLAQIGVEDFSASAWYKENEDSLGDRITKPATEGAVKLVITIVTLVIALFTMFFIFRDAHRLRDPVCEIVPLPREDTLRILDNMAKTIRAVFIAVVLVAIIQGTLAGIAFAVVGIPGAALWGGLSIILACIPLLGAPVVYVPLGLLLLAQGQVWQGIGLLLFGFLVVSQIDNVLRPYFISLMGSLHPMAVFFFLLGGVLALGPIGLMAGPMLLTLILGLSDVVRTRRRLLEGNGQNGEAEPEPAPA